MGAPLRSLVVLRRHLCCCVSDRACIRNGQAILSGQAFVLRATWNPRFQQVATRIGHGGGGKVMCAVSPLLNRIGHGGGGKVLSLHSIESNWSRRRGRKSAVSPLLNQIGHGGGGKVPCVFSPLLN